MTKRSCANSNGRNDAGDVMLMIMMMMIMIMMMMMMTTMVMTRVTMVMTRVTMMTTTTTTTTTMMMMMMMMMMLMLMTMNDDATSNQTDEIPSVSLLTLFVLHPINPKKPCKIIPLSCQDAPKHVCAAHALKGHRQLLKSWKGESDTQATDMP